ncbi:hypothetical protein [Streptomyces sp. NPDC050804]|uniref:hypothetical protein n=1 Tax=Streptomyces sp. NPDC050804 TaxID=3154745 RepID=UPI0034120541
MFRTRLGLAAAIAIGAVTLTACGSGDSDASGTAPSGDGVQKAAGQQAAFATSAVLFDDKNFADNGSQGLSGTGCKNVARKGVTSSIQAGGSMIIWTGANCTGTSRKIEGDVADLAPVGFDNNVTSVFFGEKAAQPPAGGNGNNAAVKGSAVLLDDPNDPSENNVARGVSGVGCLNVPAPGSASGIIHMSGPARVWDGPGCKGEVRVINKDILDLGTITFDNKIASVRFI